MADVEMQEGMRCQILEKVMTCIVVDAFKEDDLTANSNLSSNRVITKKSFMLISVPNENTFIGLGPGLCMFI